MGHIFLGHGALSQPSDGDYNEGMEVVAIPRGTTMQFYTDFGQSLIFPDGIIFSEMWSKLQQPWPALTEENVTYNMTLAPLEDERALWVLSDTNVVPGYDLHIIGFDDDIGPAVQICTGTRKTCPTVPGMGLTHKCDGLLGRYTGELHWLACTKLNYADLEKTEIINAALGGRPWGATIGKNPDVLDTETKTAKNEKRLHEEVRALIQMNPDGMSTRKFIYSLAVEQIDTLMHDEYVWGWMRSHPELDARSAEWVAAVSEQARNMSAKDFQGLVRDTPALSEREIILRADDHLRGLMDQEVVEDPGGERVFEPLRVDWVTEVKSYTPMDDREKTDYHNWLYPESGETAQIDEILRDPVAANTLHDLAEWYLNSSAPGAAHFWFYQVLTDDIRNNFIANRPAIADWQEQNPNAE